MNRRRFFASSGVILADQLLGHATPAGATKRAAEKAHYLLRIAPCKLEIAPGIVIDTIGYNGQVPGPILRVGEGVVDFVADNHGDMLLHCHQVLHMDFGFMQLMKYVG